VATGQVAEDGRYALTSPPGVDAFYAFCETSTTTSPAKYKGQKGVICTAVMSRGNLIATARVFGKSPTLTSAHAALKLAVRPIAAALAAAVPRPTS
jgi:hypothetical protein